MLKRLNNFSLTLRSLTYTPKPGRQSYFNVQFTYEKTKA